jgi:8-oxo-dGTP diphosphatase
MASMAAGAIEIAAAVIGDGAGRVLVARRRAADHLGGLFEFPGGKVRPGETPEEACRRECREELGVEVLVGREAAPRVVHAYPERTVAISFFRCTLAPWSPAPRALAAEEVRWVETARLAELAWPEANRRVIARLVEESAGSGGAG